jgi:adenylosuccinate lyase
VNKLGKLKELTRGRGFINNLPIPEQEKTRLLEMTPSSYIGNAVSQAKGIEKFH